jgi:hypothetical protein
MPESAVPPDCPFHVPTTAEIRARMEVLSREWHTLQAMLQAALKHDRAREGRKRVRGADDAR